MKLISWNVNGIRAVLKKNFLDYITEEDPDILCLQETKATKEQVDATNITYPYMFWNSAKNKKGYSGTAIFTKIKPLTITYDMNMPEHDQEGRVITAEFEKYYVVNVYTPNSKRGLLRLDYRQVWDADFLAYIKTLDEKKPVILCGDLNVAHTEIDLKNPESNTKNAGFTPEERKGMDAILAANFIDTFRHFHPDEIKYTWWSYMFYARQKGIGWRIDYVITSKSFINNVHKAFIRDDIEGSDHCPVGIEYSC
ncbi:MAG: exodeoxyribonuclease III [Candidatus Woesearchaeota archaeon]